MDGWMDRARACTAWQKWEKNPDVLGVAASEKQIQER
jgi:hypothetical protein